MFQFTKEEQRAIDGAVEEMVQSFARQKREAELRKDIIARMKDEFGLDGKMFNTVVKERIDDKVSEQVGSLQAALDLNDDLIASRRGM